MPKSELGSTNCFQSQDGLTFLSVATGHAEDVDVTFLADFPTCKHMPAKVTKRDLRGWKTPEGIGLGSTEKDVLKAYGKPSPIEKTFARDLWTRSLKGYRKGEALPDPGQKIIEYAGMELHWAQFGIRDGKVSYILISDSE
jgi:hypothetical protein